MTISDDDVTTLRDDVRTAVEGVTARFDRSYYLDKARRGEPAEELWQAMAEQGLLALGVPEEYGGAGGGLLATTATMEAMSQSGIPPLMFSLTSFCRDAILRNGTEEQIFEHIVPTTTGKRRICFGLTEPDAGTNSFAMSTTARRQPDGSYRIEGQKAYISGADHAGWMLLGARAAEGTDARGRDVHLFMVDLATRGITMDRMDIEMHAPEAQFIVHLDDVHVPAEARIGQEGERSSFFDSLNSERVVTSAWAIGLGDFALAKAVEFTKTRAPWGVPTGGYQAVQHPLARAKIKLEAARLMIYRAAREFDAGSTRGELPTMSKYLAAEAAGLAVDAAIQVHGGQGFDATADVVLVWPMIRLLRVAPLNDEMVLNYVGERILGLPRSY